MATNVNRGSADRAISRIGGGRRWRQILLIFALAVVTVVMLRSSLAYIVGPLDPALALRFDAGNAEVEALRAQQLLSVNPSTADRASAEQLARRALVRSPVSAAGARTFGAARDLAGDTAGARRMMVYSESVSRRDLPTQLWLIEDAVRHNDIPEALRHYDIALRSSDAAAPLLFPVLVAATAETSVVDGLVRTLAAKPLWADPFLRQVSQGAPDLDGLGRLLTGLAKLGYKLPDGAVASATSRLIESGRYDLAWQIYAFDRRDAVRGRLNDPDFSLAGSGTTPFDWALPYGDGLFAEPRIYGANHRLAYSASTGAGGVVARQLLLLPKGSFIITGRAFTVAPENNPPQLRLTCVGSGQRIGTIAATSSGSQGAAFAGRFVVQELCPAQWLEIFIDGGDTQSGASGAVGGLHILPVR